MFFPRLDDFLFVERGVDESVNPLELFRGQPSTLIWPIEEQICAEGHTIDAREADHSYTDEVQLTRSASTT